MKIVFQLFISLFVSYMNTHAHAAAELDESSITGAKDGRYFFYYKSPKDHIEKNIRQGDVLSFDLTNETFIDDLKRRPDPVEQANFLREKANGKNLTAIQIVLRSDNPDSEARKDTYFVVLDNMGTLKTFIKESCEDTRNASVSAFSSKTTFVFSGIRFSHAMKRFKEVQARTAGIILEPIAADILETAALVFYDSKKGGPQLVKSNMTSSPVYTEGVCDCICLCASSPSKKEGLIAHVNHEAIKATASDKPETDFQKLVTQVRSIGDDVKIQLVSSYISVKLQLLINLFSVIDPSLSAHSFPITYEANEKQEVISFADPAIIPFNTLNIVFSGTFGGLTVLFDPGSGKLVTDITTITLEEKKRHSS